MKIIGLILFQFLCFGLAFGQDCNGLAQANIGVISGHCDFAAPSIRKNVYVEPTGCGCMECFCYIAQVINVDAGCFSKHLTVVGTKKAKVVDIKIDYKQSNELSKLSGQKYTVVYFKFIPRNQVQAQRKYQRHKKLKFQFAIVHTETKQVYFKDTVRFCE